MCRRGKRRTIRRAGGRRRGTRGRGTSSHFAVARQLRPARRLSCWIVLTTRIKRPSSAGSRACTRRIPRAWLASAGASAGSRSARITASPSNSSRTSVRLRPEASRSGAQTAQNAGICPRRAMPSQPGAAGDRSARRDLRKAPVVVAQTVDGDDNGHVGRDQSQQSVAQRRARGTSGERPGWPREGKQRKPETNSGRVAVVVRSETRPRYS